MNQWYRLHPLVWISSHRAVALRRVFSPGLTPYLGPQVSLRVIIALITDAIAWVFRYVPLVLAGEGSERNSIICSDASSSPHHLRFSSSVP
eukprot:SAG22_NODE_440_length_10484_cov_19.751661_1_plen_91_part_00